MVCNFVKNIMGPKFQQNKEDVALAKKIFDEVQQVHDVTRYAKWKQFLDVRERLDERRRKLRC
jgi:hypothetical protein